MFYNFTKNYSVIKISLKMITMAASFSASPPTGLLNSEFNAASSPEVYAEQEMLSEPLLNDIPRRLGIKCAILSLIRMRCLIASLHAKINVLSLARPPYFIKISLTMWTFKTKRKCYSCHKL